MTETNLFALEQVIKAAGSDPSDVTDAVWAAGYRQPPRTEQEAAQITIDTFFYCNSFGMPIEFWPANYDAVLENELMKAVLTDDDDDACRILHPRKVAESILAAGFAKVVTGD